MGTKHSDSVWMAILEITAFKGMESAINALAMANEAFMTETEESGKM
jgi:hypothetical protein